MDTNIESTAFPDVLERGCEHVLVVDDDDMVRSHVVRQLALLGYQVSEAPNGSSGIKIIRERPDIDLLFTDIVMLGGMSGFDLAEQARLLRPELPILLTSGYGVDDLSHGDFRGRNFALLQKPYRRRELARRLSQMFRR